MLRDKGVFAQALIKKRSYWPAKVPRGVIDNYMEEHDIGETKCMIKIAPFLIICFV